jgi:GeoRSP system SPASM domain protein
MTKSKLDAPLRVFWDINYFDPYEGEILKKEDLLKIADRIVSCKPFFVNLGENILSLECLRDILKKFNKAHIKLSLSSSALITDKDKFSYLKDHKIDFLEFRLDPFIETIMNDISYLDKISETLEIYAEITEKVCPSLIVTKHNYHLLPQLLDYFADKGIKYFKMPNTVINERTINSISSDHLLYEDVQKLRNIIKDKVSFYKSKIKFFIHDLFIFEIFFSIKDEASERVEFTGCQAGNALCYIDQKGELYLCSSLSVSLGNVLEQDIKALFKSEKRAKYLKMLDEQYDKKCIQCMDFTECRGGCRGIVYFINDSFLGLDPLCPHKDND